MRHQVCLTMFFVLALGCASAVNAETVTTILQDGGFADWSAVIHSGNGTTVASTQATGGAPDAWRKVEFIANDYTPVAIADLWNNAKWSPSTQGAVTGLTLSFSLDPPQDSDLPQFSDAHHVNFAMLLRQAGNLYISTTAVLPRGGDTWMSIPEQTLLPGNFTKLSGSGPALPDFSALGSDIQFGYYAECTTAKVSPTPAVFGIDNWTVAVTATTVPEPSVVMSLASLALVGLVAAWRRSRRAA